jgi:hypothetical protein
VDTLTLKFRALTRRFWPYSRHTKCRYSLNWDLRYFAQDCVAYTFLNFKLRKKKFTFTRVSEISCKQSCYTPWHMMALNFLQWVYVNVWTYESKWELSGIASQFSPSSWSIRPISMMSSQTHGTFLCQRLWWKRNQEQYRLNVYFNIAGTVNNWIAETQDKLLNCFGFEVPTAMTEELSSCCWFLFGLFFCPEYGVDMFLRNVRLSPNYTALQHAILLFLLLIFVFTNMNNSQYYCQVDVSNFLYFRASRVRDSVSAERCARIISVVAFAYSWFCYERPHGLSHDILLCIRQPHYYTYIYIKVNVCICVCVCSGITESFREWYSFISLFYPIV